MGSLRSVGIVGAQGYRHVESVHAQKEAQRGTRKQRGAGTREHSMNRLDDGLTTIISNTCIPWYVSAKEINTHRNSPPQ